MKKNMLPFFLLPVLLLSACGGDSTPPANTKPAAGNETAQPTKPAKPEYADMTGKWEMRIHSRAPEAIGFPNVEGELTLTQTSEEGKAPAVRGEYVATIINDEWKQPNDNCRMKFIVENGHWAAHKHHDPATGNWNETQRLSFHMRLSAILEGDEDNIPAETLNCLVFNTSKTEKGYSFTCTTAIGKKQLEGSLVRR